MQPTIVQPRPITPTIRRAKLDELAALTALMEQSVRRLNIQHYSQQQIESALEHVFGIDAHLIADGTYYIAEIDGALAGCGGWSRSSKLFGGSQIQNGFPHAHAASDRDDAAKIRAFFVHPDFTRRGIGRQLMQISERDARREGFARLELIATLTGEALYRKCGFTPVATVDLVLPDGVSLQALQMEKWL